ncbi:MAG: DivIVA domain-containing protein [Acutalibacteraceae bacterium]
MQTLDEIKSVSFRKISIGGYRPDDVDTFVDDVITTFEQMQREKNDLLKKLEILAKRIEEYKSDEDCVRTALLSAQKLGDQAIKDAQKKADEIIAEAEKNAEKIRQESNAYMIEQKSSFLKLHTESAKLRNQLLETYKNHLKMIDNLPTMEVVKDKKADLDSKFPTEPIGEVSSPSKEEAKEDKKDDIVKESLKLEDAKAKDNKDADNNLSSFSGKAQSDKKKSDKRFSDLKFGSDFDINSDSKKKKN